MPIRNYLSSEDLKKLQDEVSPLGKALETIGCHAVVTDVDGNILYANKHVLTQTGYSPEETIGKNPGDLWGGQMTDDFYQKMWQTIKAEKNIYNGEVRNKKKDGTEYWQEVIISPIIGDSGEVRFFVAIEPDITGRKEAEAVQREFMSLIAHQLRNPLTAIRWLVEEIIKENGLRPNQQKNIEEIALHDHSLINLINDFLAVSRGTHNGERVEDFDLKVQVGQLIEQHRSVRPDLKISFDTQGEITFKTSTKTLVNQVFDNLITNAIIYADPIAGEINISLKQNKDQFLFGVDNNGPLIPSADQPHIFTKLYRGDNALVSNPTGSGLGLYIVKMICDNNGWNVSFKSPDEDGRTRFTVSIPRG